MNNIAAKLREVHWRAGWETDDGARVRRQREREEGADEIERLTAEVEKLKADIAYADKHAAKVESLLWGTAQENERLRAALEVK